MDVEELLNKNLLPLYAKYLRKHKYSNKDENYVRHKLINLKKDLNNCIRYRYLNHSEATIIWNNKSYEGYDNLRFEFDKFIK